MIVFGTAETEVAPRQMAKGIVNAIVKHKAGEPVAPRILVKAELYTKDDAMNDPTLK